MNRQIAKNECRHALRFSELGSRSKEDIQTILEYLCLSKMIPKAMIEEHDLIEKLCQQLQFVNLEKNTIIFLQGQPATSHYLIFSGHVEIHHTNCPDEAARIRHEYGDKIQTSLGPYFARERIGEHQARVEESYGFGEVRSDDDHHTVSAIAPVPCELIEIGADLYTETLKPFHEDQEIIGEAFEILHNHILCRGLSGRVLTKVAYEMEAVKFSPRTKICLEGSPIQHVILIDRGAVKELKLENKVQVEVSVRIKGMLLGAVELLHHATHYAHSYVAVTPTVGFTISKHGFDTLMSHKDSVQAFLDMEEAFSEMTTARKKKADDIKNRMKEDQKGLVRNGSNFQEQRVRPASALSAKCKKTSMLHTLLKKKVAYKRPVSASSNKKTASAEGKRNASQVQLLFPAKPPPAKTSPTASPKTRAGARIVSPEKSIKIAPVPDLAHSEQSPEGFLRDEQNFHQSLGEHLGHKHSFSMNINSRNSLFNSVKNLEGITEQLLSDLGEINKMNANVPRKSLGCRSFKDSSNVRTSVSLLGVQTEDDVAEPKKRTGHAPRKSATLGISSNIRSHCLLGVRTEGDLAEINRRPENGTQKSATFRSSKDPLNIPETFRFLDAQAEGDLAEITRKPENIARKSTTFRSLKDLSNISESFNLLGVQTEVNVKKQQSKDNLPLLSAVTTPFIPNTTTSPLIRASSVRFIRCHSGPPLTGQTILSDSKQNTVDRNSPAPPAGLRRASSWRGSRAEICRNKIILEMSDSHTATDGRNMYDTDLVVVTKIVKEQKHEKK